MNDETVKNMMVALAEWHKERVENCKLITEKVDADIVLNTEYGQQYTVKAGTKEASCIRLGVMLALEQFTPFPVVPVTVTFDESPNADEDCDDE